MISRLKASQIQESKQKLIKAGTNSRCPFKLVVTVRRIKESVERELALVYFGV